MSAAPTALETKVDLLLVQQAEIKAAVEKFQDHCRDDMRSVYTHINSVEDAMDERMRCVEAHASCQKGKGMSWDKMVLIGTAIFVFLQAMATLWPKI